MTKTKVKRVRFRNDRLRLKLTDQCNLRCPFCHFEGARKTAQVSLSDPLLAQTLERLRSHYRIVWLTGGEPTLYERLPEMIALVRELGYEADMTSNGVFDLDRLHDSLGRLGWLNISFHSLSPVYVRKLVPRGSDVGRTIDIVRNNISALKGFVPMAINAVVGRENEEQRIRDIYEYARDEGIPLKLVPDWRSVDEARRLILKFLRAEGYRLAEIVHIHPGSNVRKIYFNGDRSYKIEFKDIVPYRPDFLCHGCTLRDRCIECFAFIRLEGDPLRARLCIHKPPIDMEEFFRFFESHLRPLQEECEYDLGYRLNYRLGRSALTAGRTAAPDRPGSGGRGKR